MISQNDAGGPGDPLGFLNPKRYEHVPTEGTDGESTVREEHSAGDQREGQSSTRVAVVNFFKGLFGAGVLAIPHAFESTGLPLGIICFALVAILCLGTMLILLECQRLVRVRSRSAGKPPPRVATYEEVAGAVFGAWGFHTVQIFMSLLTLIFCTGFLIVISNSLHDVFPHVTRETFCLLVYPVLMLLSWITYIKDLWLTSIFGLVVYLVGVVGTSVYASIKNYQPPPDALEFRWRGLPHFFGVVVYSLEGINLTLPIASSMKSERKPPLVMTIGTLGFSFITITYAALAYGSGHGSCDIIVQCLGSGPLVTTVKLALSISLVMTHPVYLIVASKIFERTLLGPEPSPHSHENKAWGFKARIIRALEVALTCVVAAIVPDLGRFTAVVGSSALTFVGFVLPCLMWLSLIRDTAEHRERIVAYAVAGTVVLLGLVAMAVGTYEGVKAWM